MILTTTSAANGDTVLAVPIGSDNYQTIDFGDGVSVGAQFTFQTGADGVATLTLASRGNSFAGSYSIAAGGQYDDIAPYIDFNPSPTLRQQSFVIDLSNSFSFQGKPSTIELSPNDLLDIEGEDNAVSVGAGYLDYGLLIDDALNFAGGSVAIENLNLSSSGLALIVGNRESPYDEAVVSLVDDTITGATTVLAQNSLVLQGADLLAQTGGLRSTTTAP